MSINVHLLIVLLVSFFVSCGNVGDDEVHITTDTAAINRGKALFRLHCANCHKFQTGGIGPALGGITDSVSVMWMKSFIRNPQAMLDKGDERSKKMVTLFKSVMPSFDQLSEIELNDIIAYIHSRKKDSARHEVNGVADPITASIELSDVVIQIEQVAQVPASSSNGKPPLARITKLDYLPGTNQLFVVDMRGKLFRLNGKNADEYLDISRYVKSFVYEPGLGAGFCSFAFHPSFLKNGLLYTAHTEKPGKVADFNYNDSIPVTYQYVLTEWKASDPYAKVFNGASRELFRIDMVTVQHGIQEIAFDPFLKPGERGYGLLYVCIGDGGAMDDKHTSLAGSPHMPWGTVFRIDPAGNDSKNGKYGIPPGNPFAKNSGGLGEVYAYGFRNPHRISWSAANEGWVANIGEAHIESVYELKKGMHHGWPIREGTFRIDPEIDVTKLLPMNAADSAVPINYPVASYGHEWGYAGISGGFVYMGKDIPSLQGKYIFGDIPSGKLFYFDFPPNGAARVKEWRIAVNDTISTLKSVVGSNRADLHFGRDESGELYILSKANGKIYKLVKLK
ncbi:MAG: PQQ-dependent sugar dehydrogenase [Chitinophagaceae bacterium]|nr:PQQ-dependent sugar dehydrogenase [Chitinophagaceae bacterium]